jgi:A/G-specific adenine glycosylase
MPSKSPLKPSVSIASAPFRRKLLAWYDANKRDLPWRKNKNLYNVWLSEIMLQQTRVVAVIDHYQRFLLKFPTVEKLAKAKEASVLAAWSGLGYYRRARMLHAAAKKVVQEHDGVFPRTSAELKDLPGIGRYTSAAIASIAYDEPVAVVDGNVERVLGRISGKHLEVEAGWDLANQLLELKRPGDFNQAMMELGATVCLPQQPMCLVCPVHDFCRAKSALPRVEKSPRQKKKTIHYAFDRRDESVFLVQRSHAASLMAGMWELPEIVEPNGDVPKFILKHSITVTDYTVHIVEKPASNNVEGRWVSNSKVVTLPLTGLARKILRKAGII